MTASVEVPLHHQSRDESRALLEGLIDIEEPRSTLVICLFWSHVHMLERIRTSNHEHDICLSIEGCNIVLYPRRPGIVYYRAGRVQPARAQTGSKGPTLWLPFPVLLSDGDQLTISLTADLGLADREGCKGRSSKLHPAYLTVCIIISSAYCDDLGKDQQS